MGTGSYGIGGPFVWEVEAVRTWGMTRPYGGNDLFVRGEETFRTEGEDLSYGVRKGESRQESVGGLQEPGDRETVGTGP